MYELCSQAHLAITQLPWTTLEAPFICNL